MELRVYKVNQASSGGSHVTIYEAEFDLVPGVVVVDIATIDPSDARPVDVEAARRAIQKGAEEALRSTGFGANVRVRHLVIHPVDFKAWRLEQHTAEELGRLLKDSLR